MALLAQHCGVDGDVLLHAGECLVQRDGGAQQRVVARLHAGTGLPRAAATAEERLEDVAQAPTEACAAAHAAARLHRVAATVHNRALLRVQQDLLGSRDLRELLRRLFGRVHVRVVLARQLAVRLLNLLLGGFLVHAEDAVVIASHNFPSIRPAGCG